MSEHVDAAVLSDQIEEQRAAWKKEFGPRPEPVDEPEQGAVVVPEEITDDTPPPVADPADPHPGLTAARAALAAERAERARLAEELHDQEEAARVGVPDAVAAAAELRTALEKAETKLGTATRRAERAEAAHASEARRVAELAETDRLIAIPRVARQYRQLAGEVQTAGEQLAQALRLLATQAGPELAAAIGTDEARRLFSEGNILSRVRECLALAFMTRPGSADRSGRLLEWPINPASPFGRRTFVEVELQSLAHAQRFYADRADADAARTLLDPVGLDWHVIGGPGARAGLFEIVLAPLKGKARQAALDRQAAAEVGTPVAEQGR